MEKENMVIEPIKGLFIGEKNILDIELKEPNLNKALTQKLSYRSRGSVRLSLGLFYTRSEWEQKRKSLLAEHLP